MAVGGALLLAYLAGSIPFGVVLSRWLTGEDVRHHGSGNIGATNVARLGGLKLGAGVLLLDAAKGALPVLGVQRLFPDAPWIHAGAGLCAFLGHVFPVWLRFKGGKGVATFTGVVSVLAPLCALVGAAVYGVVFAVSRVSSLSSLLAAAVGAGSAWLFPVAGEVRALLLLLLALMLWTHRENLGRLRRGTESKL